MSCRTKTGRVLCCVFAAALAVLLLGGHAALNAESTKGGPAEENVFNQDRKAILLILSGGLIAIGSALGIYIFERRQPPPAG
jgi:hypothetical protein